MQSAHTYYKHFQILTFEMFFLKYDINNEIDVQCIWSRDNIFFNAYEYNILASVYLGHCTTFT